MGNKVLKTISGGGIVRRIAHCIKKIFQKYCIKQKKNKNKTL